MSTTHILIAIRRPEWHEDTHPELIMDKAIREEWRKYTSMVEYAPGDLVEMDHIPDARKKVDTKLICKICGEDQNHVHVHEWVEAPKVCTCPISGWRENLEVIPPICDNLTMTSSGQDCANCEHDAGCHQ